MTTDPNAQIVHVEVAYAMPHKQMILAVEVPAGTTVREAARHSKIADHFDGLDLDGAEYGVFGRRVDEDREVRSGDRVEIYRALTADPKEVRRQLAKLGKSMGKPTGRQ